VAAAAGRNDTSAFGQSSSHYEFCVCSLPRIAWGSALVIHRQKLNSRRIIFVGTSPLGLNSRISRLVLFHFSQRDTKFIQLGLISIRLAVVQKTVVARMRTENFVSMLDGTKILLGSRQNLAHVAH